MSRFAIIPVRALDDERMSPAALRVLLEFGRHTDKDGWCHPTQETIAARMGVTRQAVNNQAARLQEWGYLERGERLGPGRPYRWRVLFDQPATATSGCSCPAGETNSNVTLLLTATSGSCYEQQPPEVALYKENAPLERPIKTVSGVVASQPPPTTLLDLSEDPFWQAHAKALDRLRAGSVPDELLDPAYLATVEALTDGTEVFWDDELLKYQAWWANQPPSGRHRSRRRGFQRWLAKAMASDRWRERKEAERARSNGSTPRR